MMASDGHVNNMLNDFYARIPNFVKVNTETRSMFIASFTKTRDNLRQWMAYGRPNSSYSIGFDPNVLAEKSLSYTDELIYKFKEVDYELDTMIEPVLNRGFIESTIKGSSLSAYLKKMVNELMFGCCLIKRKEFKDENESRMVFQTKEIEGTYSGTNFRNLGGVVAPYIEVPIPLNAIREIIIGPTLSKDLAEKGVKKMLRQMGLDCKVKHSDCTLRQY